MALPRWVSDLVGTKAASFFAAEFRTRVGNTGGGDGFLRNLWHSVVGYTYWTDGSGNRTFGAGHNDGSGTALALFVGATPVGGDDDALTIHNDGSTHILSAAVDAFHIPGILRPSISGAQNNWAPSGITNSGITAAAVISATLTANASITGLAANQLDGTRITIANDSAFLLTITNASASSTAANRFLLPATIVLAQYEATTFRYDASLSRWMYASGSKGVTSLNGLVGPVVVTSSDTSISVTPNALTGVIDITTGGSGGATIDIEIAADNPTSWYKGNEPSGTTLIDYGSAGINLTLAADASLAKAPLFPKSNDLFWQPCRTTGGTSGASASGNPVGVATYSGDWTMMAVCNITSITSTYRALMGIVAGGGQYQALLYIHGNLITAYWTTAAGNQETTPAAWGQTGFLGTYIFHLVKDATAKTVQLYANGVPIGLPLGYSNECSAVNSSPTISVGADGAGTNYFAQGATGHHGFFYGVKLTQARIAAHAYAAGLYANL